MEGTGWDFDAPTFVDFGNDEHERDDGVDNYFCYDHEGLRSASTEMDEEDLPDQLHSSQFADVRNDNSRLTFDTPKKINPTVPKIAPTGTLPREQENNQTIKISSSNDIIKPIDNAGQMAGALVDSPIDSNDEMAESETNGGAACKAASSNVSIPSVDSLDEMTESENVAPINAVQLEFQIKTVSNDSIANAVVDCYEYEAENSVANPPAESMDEMTQSETENTIRQTKSQMEVEVNFQSIEQAGQTYASENGQNSASTSTIQVPNVAKENQNANGAPQPPGEIGMDVDALSAEHDDKVEEKEEKHVVHLPSNIVTPSRLATWEQSRKRRSGVSAQSKQIRSRSQRLEKRKEWRRSGRSLTTTNKPETDQPPLKKIKKIVLVTPTTPTVMKHQRHVTGPRIKTREEREAEEIEKLKNKQRERIKESSKSLKAALKGPAPRPATASKLTKVKEFCFKTDQRIQSHSMETRSKTLSSDADFVKGLRQHPPSPKKLTRTVVKPFNLTESRKRRFEIEPQNNYDFKPMAKAVLDFQRGTRSSKAPETTKGPMKAKPSLTIAKTPKLQSKSRKRELNVIGADKMEELEIEEMRNYHFKAKPANQKILHQPAVLPQVEKMPSTEPEGFDLHIEKRIQERPKHEKTPSPTREFRARPVPKTVIEGNMHILKSDRSKLTVAQSPAFKLKSRMDIAQKIRENKENIEKEEQKLVQKLKPKTSAPENLKPRHKSDVSERRSVEVQPFSFHDRDQERFAKKEEKIRDIHKAERAAASAFRATPIVEDDPHNSLPPKQVRHTTVVKPFHLRTDERGAARSGQWKNDVEEELKALREKADFKANNAYHKVLHSDGWKPKLEQKCTETFEEFPLHTNTRAVERQEFDERMKEKGAEFLAKIEERKRQQEMREQQEAEEIRRQAGFEAAQVRVYKELEIRDSERQLTQPQSPNFSDRFYKKN